MTIVKEKLMGQIMKMARDPKIMIRSLLEELSPMDIDIRIHGIKKMKDKDEERLFISILMPKMPKVELPEVQS